MNPTPQGKERDVGGVPVAANVVPSLCSGTTSWSRQPGQWVHVASAPHAKVKDGNGSDLGLLKGLQ